jgi:tetratricopeptide (TPR) repeat protein
VAALFERILSIVDHAQPPRAEDVVMWSRNLGQVYAELGEYTRADPLFARAVALTEKTQPEWLSHELLSQAKFYRESKKYDRATTIATRALELREQALRAAPDNVDRRLDLSIALDEIAQIHLGSGQLAAAEAEARRSLTNLRTSSDENNPELGSRLAALADVLRARGKYDESAEICRQLVTLTEKTLGPNSTELADALSHYADVLRALRKTDEATQADAKAAAIRRKTTAGA